MEKESIKVSPRAKKFLSQMKLNRIKLDKKEIDSFSDAIEMIERYFKKHNDYYLEMLKEERQDG